MPAWLWPGWAAVWPNILASLIWAVPGALAHLRTRRHLTVLHHKQDRMHADLKGDKG